MRILPCSLLLASALVLAACGGGGGGSKGNPTPSVPPKDNCANAACSNTSARGNAMLGPVVGATVSVFDALALGYPQLCQVETKDADTLQDAGSIEVPASCLQNADFFVVHVSGGVDIDPEDDGVRNAVPTPVLGQFRALIPRNSLIENNWKVSALTEVVYQAIEYGIHVQDTHESLGEQLNLMATMLLKEDVNQDGIINYDDILRWNPILDKQLAADIRKVEEQAREILQNKNSFAKIAPLNAPFVAQLDVNANAKKVATNETSVFVAGPASIKIVDKSTNEITASIPTGFVSDMHVVDNTLWVSLGAAGLRAYDVADATAPVLAATSDIPVDRLANNDGIWAAWIEQGNAQIAKLVLDQGSVVFTNTQNVGEASYLGVFKPIDTNRFAVSVQLMSSLSEKLRIVSVATKQFDTVLTLNSMEFISSLLVKDNLIYVSNQYVGGTNAYLRAFQINSDDSLTLLPLNARSGTAFSSLTSTPGAILGVAADVLHVLNPYTLDSISTVPLVASIDMIAVDSDNYWLAHGQAGLVKAQFSIPVIPRNTSVSVDFGGLQNFQYTIKSGGSDCFVSEPAVNEINVDQECFGTDGFVVIDIEGGQLQDADADGTPDNSPSIFSGKISTVVTPAELNNGIAHVSVLGNAFYRLFGDELSAGEISLAQYKQKADLIAKVWMKSDINGDAIVNQRDIAEWVPSETSYDNVVLTREQVGEYFSALINNADGEGAIKSISGTLQNAISPVPRLNVLGGNDQYLLGATGYSNGENASSTVYLMDASDISALTVLDEIQLDGYVSSLIINDSLAYAGLTNGEGVVLELSGGNLSELRRLPNCGIANWYGDDLVCAGGLQTISRVNPYSGTVTWTKKDSTYMFSSVLTSTNLLAIESGTSSFTGRVTLMNPVNGNITNTLVTDSPMSQLQPFYFSNDALYTSFGALGSGTGRIDRLSIDGNNVLDSINISIGRIKGAEAIGDALAIVGWSELLMLNSSDLTVLSRQISGISSFRSVVKAGSNWVILTDESNLLVYGIDAGSSSSR